MPSSVVLQVRMQLDSQGLQAQEAAETARREAGKLGMKVLQQQMQVSRQFPGKKPPKGLDVSLTSWRWRCAS